MSRLPVRFLEYDEVVHFSDNEIESARTIDQSQLDGAKIYTSREEYAKHLPSGMKWMEIGIAWGYYSDLVCSLTNPEYTELVDNYDQDLKCWSWRRFGECKCQNQRHELLYTPETHEQYIIEKFSKYKNVVTTRGHAPEILGNDSDYDYIYIDTENDRYEIRDMLKKTRNMVKVGGIIGLNDYVIYDGVILDMPHGTFQSVHEFLHFNPNWSVDAIALHSIGFNDIYLRKMS
jgi:hypothetical protein